MPDDEPTGGHVTRVLAPDGVSLAVHELGAGEPLVCLPGGPMRASRYLGDLGGLSSVRRLVRPDLRGTGASAPSPDPTGYRTDRLVPDVEALREHLGLERMDLLGHSAGASLAMLYAVRHPERVRRLVLVTPSLRAVGFAVSDEDRRAVADLRADEPWFPAASAALHALAAGTATEDDEEAVTPFFYGRYDDAARAHHAGAADEMNVPAAAASVAAGAFDPEATKEALARLEAPALVLAGELDVNTPPARVAELVALMPRGELAVQPGGGHYPWLDDPDAFVRVVAEFLSGPTI